MPFSFTRKRDHELIRNSEESEETLLPSHEEEKGISAPETCHACGRSTVQKTPSSWGDTLTSWALVICLLCTIVNSLLTLDRTSNSPSPMDRLLTFDRKNYDSLKRPSPFIGLDKIARPKVPTPRSFVNYPQAIMLIDATKPDLVFDDDPKRYMSYTGVVSPEDRLVKLSKSISTVVEFRAVDFGMEKCELIFRAPANVTALAHGSPVESFFVGIHRLDTDKPLDPRVLSYNTVPRRLTNVANIEIHPGKPVDFHASFHCPWDTVLTFELACFGEERKGFNEGDCSLEWWQDKDLEVEDPQTAVFIRQHATV